jgi:hypothetical protein
LISAVFLNPIKTGKNLFYRQRRQETIVVPVEYNIGKISDSKIRFLLLGDTKMGVLLNCGLHCGRMIKLRMSRFNKNQKGLEALQVVLIIAVAAVILALVVNQWPTIRDWANGAIDYITGDTDIGDGGSEKS